MAPLPMRAISALAVSAGVLLLAAPASADPPRHGARIEDLAALRELGGPFGELALSPDGRSIALIERETDLDADAYRHRLLIVDVDGAMRVVADAGGFVLRSDGGRRSGIAINRTPQFSPDGAWIYFLKESGGGVEIWRASSDGSAVARVVGAEGDVRRFRVAASRIVFETITPRTRIAAQRLREERRGFLADEAFTPSYSLRPLPDEDSGRTLWVFDLASGQVAPAGTDDEAFLGDRASGSSRIGPIDPSSRVDETLKGLFFSGPAGEMQCGDPACTGALQQSWDSPARNDDDPEIIFMRREGHARALTALYAWRPRVGTVRLIRREAERLEGCVLGDRRLFCLQDATFQPRRLVSVDLETSAFSALYNAYAEWDRIAKPRIERFEFVDAEGNESFAHLVYPLGWRRGGSYPLVIVQYHSRGFLLGGTGDETPIFPLSARGYFVLSFDRPEFRNRAQRLSNSELQRQIELDGSERSIKRAALNHFIARAIERGADRRRIAITGLSDGAETVYAMLMDEPIFAAAVVSTPPTDPIGWALQSPAYRQRSFERLGLTGPWADAPEPWRSWWEHNSPVNHVARIRTPLLFNLAEAEAIRAFPLITRLREVNTPVEAYIYPGAHHLKWRPQHIFNAQRRTMDWFDFWLRGEENADPIDPERIARWRSLRDAATAAHAAEAPSD